MKKELKNYLHLYLGCECAITGVSENDKESFKLTGISYDDTQRLWWCYFEGTEFGHAVIEDVWPILRPKSDMTDDEKALMHDTLWAENSLSYTHSVSHKCTYWHIKCGGREMEAECFNYLRKNSFDCDGLIEAGLAIDKTKMAA